jgi:AraC-like DNA-binding protein
MIVVFKINSRGGGRPAGAAARLIQAGKCEIVSHQRMRAMQINLREMQILGRSTREWIVHWRECPALKALGIQDVGVTHAAAEYAFCRLAPRFALVLGTVLGRSNVWVNGRWKKCGVGDVYLAPTGAPHAHHALKGQKWHLCWVAYEKVHGRKIIRGEHARLGRGAAHGLRDAIMGLYREVHGLNETVATHHWAELVDLSARRLIQERQIDERLLHLWGSIDKELAHPWRLETLAQRVHLSPEQLRHLCQKNFGRSPMEHLRWLRMKRAALLLERTNQKIAAIAEDTGYRNAFAFSTTFKRVIGVSPREFSRRLS